MFVSLNLPKKKATIRSNQAIKLADEGTAKFGGKFPAGTKNSH